MIVHSLVVVLAVIAGAMFGVQVRAPLQWIGAVVGVLIAGVVAAAAILSDVGSAWTGPLFAIVAAVTAVLVSAQARRDHPGFEGEGYWQRVLLVLRPRHARARQDRSGG